jgi:hypothetical protein
MRALRELKKSRANVKLQGKAMNHGDAKRFGKAGLLKMIDQLSSQLLCQFGNAIQSITSQMTGQLLSSG